MRRRFVDDTYMYILCSLIRTMHARSTELLLLMNTNYQ